MIDESDEIRDLIVREQGKPRNEAFSMEILPTIDALDWIAGRRRARSWPTRRSRCRRLFLKTKRSAFTYEPLGVIGVISPWNYPWSIPFGEVALALMAGNGVVLKPASLTPLIGERIARCSSAPACPRGWSASCTARAPAPALVESSVAKVFFTGSVETGRGVAEACARRLKGSVLELGGKDPMIVLGRRPPRARDRRRAVGRLRQRRPDVLGDRARVRDARASPSGSSTAWSTGARRLRVGDPMSWDTEIGPMVSREQFELVARAGRRRGGGGRRAALRRPGRRAGRAATAPSTRPPC